jgi:hypothetical protein
MMSVSYSTLPRALRGARLMSGDERIAPIGGIELTYDATDELFILAYIAERSTFEGRRFGAGNLDLGNVRLCRVNGRHNGRASTQR